MHMKYYISKLFLEAYSANLIKLNFYGFIFIFTPINVK